MACQQMSWTFYRVSESYGVPAKMGMSELHFDILIFRICDIPIFAEPRIGPDQGATDKEEELIHALFSTKKLIG